MFVKISGVSIYKELSSYTYSVRCSFVYGEEDTYVEKAGVTFPISEVALNGTHHPELAVSTGIMQYMAKFFNDMSKPLSIEQLKKLHNEVQGLVYEVIQEGKGKKVYAVEAHPEPDYWSPSKKSGINGVPVSSIATRLPGALTKVDYPCTCNIAQQDAMMSVVIHLNDSHHWSRNTIADWLDNLHDKGVINIEFDSKPIETRHPSRAYSIGGQILGNPNSAGTYLPDDFSKADAQKISDAIKDISTKTITATISTKKLNKELLNIMTGGILDDSSGEDTGDN